MTTRNKNLKNISGQLLPDRRGGRPESSLSLRSQGWGTPPPPGPGEGGVTTPYSWSIVGTTVTSLLRGTGGFNHLRESLLEAAVSNHSSGMKFLLISLFSHSS